MSDPFGTIDGRAVHIYTLASQQLSVRVTNYGGALVSIEAPDKSGKHDHVLLGFDSAEAYASNGGSFGAMLGRFANRIAHGSFSIDGVTYETSKNDRGATLHGGAVGFAKRLWSAKQTNHSLELSLVSADGDQGFPGEVLVKAVYTLDGCELALDLIATTTKPTPLSLGTHPYFNLSGSSATDCLAHQLTIAADVFLETDAQEIPTGTRAPVSGTVFDFTKPTAMGARIREPVAQLQHGRGYDHYFVLELHREAKEPRFAAHVVDPHSGRSLEIRTTQPGVQFYTGNQLNGTIRGRDKLYRQSAGFAIETHGFPDAPNQPDFPSASLRPRDVYHERTIYRFDVAA